MASRLNLRFSGSAGQNDLAHAVLVATLDDASAPAWQPVRAWVPLRDRVPLSMYTQQMRRPQIANEAGWVVRSEKLTLHCSYAGHGHSMEAMRDCPPAEDNPFCKPGCPVGITQQCEDSIHFSEPSEPCAWLKPEKLKMMLEQQLLWDGTRGYSYNELVIDASSYAARLPSAVEAFFYTSAANAAQVERVSDFRDAFLEEYGIPEDIVPLLRFDVSTDWGGNPEPFEATLDAREAELLDSEAAARAHQEERDRGDKDLFVMRKQEGTAPSNSPTTLIHDSAPAGDKEEVDTGKVDSSGVDTNEAGDATDSTSGAESGSTVPAERQGLEDELATQARPQDGEATLSEEMISQEALVLQDEPEGRGKSAYASAEPEDPALP